jgi:hypothetical protein
MTLNLRKVTDDDADVRPTLRGTITDLKADALEAWRVVEGTNDPPRLFRSVGIAWIERDLDGQPMIRHLDADRLRHHLAQVTRFTVWRAARKGEPATEQDVPPPMALVREMLATPEPPLPPLIRITTAPLITASGRLHDRPGYDRESRCVYAPPPGFTMPPVPSEPTEAEVAKAVATLAETWCNFPFVADADKAHALAAVLSVFGRELIDGPCPLILLTKPTPGTGASLFCSAIVRLVTGHEAAVMTQPGSEEEWGKRLTSTLLKAPSIIYLDNVTGHLDSAALNATLTSGVREDRLLGGLGERGDSESRDLAGHREQHDVVARPRPAYRAAEPRRPGRAAVAARDGDVQASRSARLDHEGTSDARARGPDDRARLGRSEASRGDRDDGNIRGLGEGLRGDARRGQGLGLSREHEGHLSRSGRRDR